MIWLMTFAVLTALYIFLTMPNHPRRDLGRLADFHYAHRGLWNAVRPENSLSAFQAAVEHGYGIELDVHMTRDGFLVVHHDDSLMRMTGADRRIADCTLDEVRDCHLPNGESVPTFDEVLAVVNGRVPLIVEVKVEQGNAAALCERLKSRMQQSSGPWCMESFDPRAVKWFRMNAPQVIRGQLAFAKRGETALLTIRNIGIASLMQNAWSRPDFIAFEAKTEKWFTLPMKIVRFWNPWLVAWTIQSQSDMNAVKGRYDLVIFEGFHAR